MEQNTERGLAFADWEGDPVVMVRDAEGLTDEAYLYKQGSWQKFDLADAVTKARLMSEAAFKRTFPNLPALPTNPLKRLRLTLPLTKAMDVGYAQPTLGVGTDAVRRESLGDGLRSKAAVGYEHPAKGPHHCSQCENFIPSNQCKLVEPPIAAADGCNLWAKRN